MTLHISRTQTLPVHALSAGARLSYNNNALLRVVPTDQFAGFAARDIAKTIRDLQRSGTVNITVSPGNTMVGVLDHLAKTGTVQAEKVLAKTPLKEADLPAFFEEPLSDDLVFRPNYSTLLGGYIGRSGTPKERFRNLTDMWLGWKKEKIDWPKTRYVHMAEYCAVPNSSTFSFASYIQRFFIDLMHPSNRIPENNITCISQDQDPIEYQAAISKVGGIDIAAVSIGANGHVAYNEPGSPATSWFRKVTLNPETVFIKDGECPVLRSAPDAYTMGIADLLEASHLFLLGMGEEKSGIVQRVLFEPASPEMPASLLRDHPAIRITIDAGAAEQLPTSYQKMIAKASNNLQEARHILLSSPLADRLDNTEITRISEKLASKYLGRVIDPEETEKLLREFCESATPIPHFDAFMQENILLFYVRKSTDLLNDVKDKDPKAKKKVEGLFQRAFKVYRFPETKNEILLRKMLIYNIIYTNIMSSFMPTASRMRLQAAVSSTLDNALSSNDPTMYKPALELIFEILATDRAGVFFNPFLSVLDKSYHLPRFAKGLVDLLMDASDGNVIFVHNDPKKGQVLFKNEFLGFTKANIAKVAGLIPGLREELIERLQALETDDPRKASLVQEMMEHLDSCK